MHATQRAALRGVAVVLSVAAVAAAPAVWAERIKMTDGTELSADVLDRDAESVIVRVKRKDVATVDGQPLPAPVAKGMPAPAFAAADLSGKSHSLEEGKGQVRLVQFWASWCPYCRKDLDLMKQLFAKYEGKGLHIITVSIDQDLEKLKTFVKHESVPFPVIFAADHPQLPALYEARGVPAYFLIDQEGKVAGAWHGSVTQTAVSGNATELEETLDKLLAAKS